MNRICNVIVLLLVAVSTATTVKAQLSYREKYAEVLRHYSVHAVDSMKYKAAIFLIDNMKGHVSPEGTPINEYINSVRAIGKTHGIHQLQMKWNSAAKTGKVVIVQDSAVVSSRYLISNIDAAFKAWENAAWKRDITFELFCRYILPYRVKDEHVGDEWRLLLRQQYAPLIEGITDMRRAFAIVRDSVFKAVVLSNNYCPYTLDPVTCNWIGKAECDQRCVLLVAVLRSLGIPSAIDGIPMWADYSNKGHAWAAMIMSNGDTYTVYEKDGMAKKFNPIDASQFLPRYEIKLEDNCPYMVKTSKTPVKVYRMCYENCNDVDVCDPKILASPFIMDVSWQYGLTADITLKADGKNPVYLCAYLSGMDWMPVAKARPQNGEVVFRGVGKGSVCVPVTINNGGRCFLSCPFLVGDNGIEKEYIPSATDKKTIHVNRKYPLCSYITNTWVAMKGGVFEAAMTETFQDADTIGVISTMPFGMTTLDVTSVKKYRYLRYCAPKNNRSSLAELQFYTTDGKGCCRLLTGIPFANGVDTLGVKNVFDGDPATSCKGLLVGYAIGIDLGENNASTISKIKFCPSTDLNFVEKRHLYELYCFDTEWRFIGRVYSNSDSLVFNNVPEGALLLLKDRTRGVEERIFEYKGDKQIWH